jgi:hypothetical protein
MPTGHGLKRLALGALLLCAMAYSTLAPAATIAALQAAGRLQIDASLAPREGIVPGQKLTLTLTIATDRWFSGGTRISLPEVPGLVILQTEQFASNASERRGESSWVIQRWTLDVYPQRPGNFTIPPVKARLQVNTADGDVEGVLSSPGVQFTVSLPPALAGLEQWVAAPAFSVAQQFDRSLEALQVGDAFERVVTFEASDVMAMMLPSLPPEDNPGLAAYPAPPVLENSNNRGQIRASRSERISYVVQAEGRYLLRARDFHWWDTVRSELRLVSLPAVEITVGSGAASTLPDSTSMPTLSPRQWLALAASLIGLGLLLWLGWRYLPRLPPGAVSARAAAALQTLRQLRKPALAESLNPGSNAGE